MSDEPSPVSAARLAEVLGDQLPPADSVPDAALALVARTRRLVEAVVRTAVDEATLRSAAEAIAAVTDTLSAARRPDAVYLVRHPDGRIESLLQAGSGRLNPQAPPLEWVERAADPPPGARPVPTTVRARCTFTDAHAGSPGRVYGGVLALALDEVLGNAVTASGVSGLTVSLAVSFKAAVPIGRPVEIRGRYDRHEGRKSFASGEVVVDGQVAVEATAVYVGERRASDEADDDQQSPKRGAPS